MKVLINLAVAPSDNVMTTQEGNLLRVYFDFQKEEVKDNEGNVVNDPVQFSCQQVDVVGRHGYGDIVSAIVNDKYSPDQIQAVMFNYELAKDDDSLISDEKREEYLAEYQTLQEYRAHAKQIASLAVIDAL